MNNEEKILTVLETMQGNLETMQGSMETMQSDISDLKNGQAKLESDMAIVKGSVIRLEKDVGVLADGHEMLNDKIDRIETHVAAGDEMILKRVFPMAAEK